MSSESICSEKRKGPKTKRWGTPLFRGRTGKNILEAQKEWPGRMTEERVAKVGKIHSQELWDKTLSLMSLSGR